MDKKTNKKRLGQFFTTNFKYILSEFYIPENIIKIIEPMCGNGDLLKWDKILDKHIIECYDIEPKKDFIIYRNTLKNPPSYNGKFLLANPPFLARNKSIDKTLYDFYDVNDLYKCLIKELLVNKCESGILIIPLNFFSSIRKSDILLRQLFIQKYDILQLNIFEERVFDDTSSSICSFQFTLKIQDNEHYINVTMFPQKYNFRCCLNDECNYTIGGEIYNLQVNNNYKISRLTKNNIEHLQNKTYSRILVKCIDDTEINRINVSLSEDAYIDDTPNLSARTYATLVIVPNLTNIQQEDIVCKFNILLNEYRTKYNSLFLANYRESKCNGFSRKRISFDLVYQIIGYLLNE